MQIFTLKPETWDDIVSNLPNPHLLQTQEWAQVKARYGWEPMPFIWYPYPATRTSRPVAAAMILKRAVTARGFAARMCVLYIPKGPLLDWNDAALRQRVLDDLQAFSRRQGALFIKIDPDVVLGRGISESEDAKEDGGGQAVISELKRQGWLFSSDQVQFRNTFLIDLSPPETELLARMKQKTRYNVRLAQRKGVTIRTGSMDDLPMLHRMYAETSVRDGFVIRDEDYYQTVWRTFMRNTPSALHPRPMAEPLVAEVAGEPVAAIFLFYFAGKAYYIYGMSREAHRDKMPNHLLQWQAMCRAKAVGCTLYDLWGAPDNFNEDDPMWGVFRFKEGLGGQVVRTLGAWDYPTNPLLYRLYTQMLPRILDIMRWRGKAKVRREVIA